MKINDWIISTAKIKGKWHSKVDFPPFLDAQPIMSPAYESKEKAIDEAIFIIALIEKDFYKDGSQLH